MSCGSKAALLLDRPFRRRQSFEARVRYRLAAVDGASVAPVREPRLRALNGRQLLAQIPFAARVELLLVEVLRAVFGGLVLLG